MTTEGHAPSKGPGNRLFLLGKGVCPDCRPEYNNIQQTPDLEPAGNSSRVCPECDATFPVAGGVP